MWSVLATGGIAREQMLAFQYRKFVPHKYCDRLQKPGIGRVTAQVLPACPMKQRPNGDPSHGIWAAARAPRTENAANTLA